MVRCLFFSLPSPTFKLKKAQLITNEISPQLRNQSSSNPLFCFVYSARISLSALSQPLRGKWRAASYNFATPVFVVCRQHNEQKAFPLWAIKRSDTRLLIICINRVAVVKSDAAGTPRQAFTGAEDISIKSCRSYQTPTETREKQPLVLQLLINRDYSPKCPSHTGSFVIVMSRFHTDSLDAVVTHGPCDWSTTTWWCSLTHQNQYVHLTTSQYTTIVTIPSRQ